MPTSDLTYLSHYTLSDGLLYDLERIARNQGQNSGSFKAVRDAAMNLKLLSQAVNYSPAELGLRNLVGFLVETNNHNIIVSETRAASGRVRMYLPYGVDTDVAALLPASEDFAWDVEYVGLSSTEVVTVDVELLNRGSVRVSYRDVFTGKQQQVYGSTFVAMIARLFNLAREVYHRDDLFLQRRLLIGRMFLLGPLLGQSISDELLVRVAMLPGHVQRLATIFTSAEFEEYARTGLPDSYLAAWFGLERATA